MPADPTPFHPRRPAVAAALMAAAWLLAPGAAQAADDMAAGFISRLSPRAVFLQLGAAGDSETLVVGATWDWSWQHAVAGGNVSGYWELSFGRWQSDYDEMGRSSAWVTQFGVTPVLRWSPGTTAGWFVEAGIGANVLAPIYRSRDKQFSTTFNFGDHIGVGWRFGQDRSQELSLRLQHFSNAGIKQPNPGENFVQLRYLVRF